MKKIFIISLLTVVLAACIKVPPLDFFKDLSPAGETVVIDDDNVFTLGLGNFSSKKVFFCVYDGEITNVVEVAPTTYQFITLKKGEHLLGVIKKDVSSGGTYFAALSPLGKNLIGVNTENKDQIVQAIINGDESYLKESSYFVAPEHLTELEYTPDHFKAIAFYDSQVVINTLDMIVERDEKTRDNIVLLGVCLAAFLGLCVFFAIPLSV